MTAPIQPGDWLRGHYWPGLMQVLTLEQQPTHTVVTLRPAEATAPPRTYVLTPAEWTHIQQIRSADYRHCAFTGDPARFALGWQAQRLRLAHAVDPYAALNASRIDPLPHQFEAVYQHLLARPVVRALLAHDAGAGKTIMAGLLLKELQRRQGIQRVFIVAPAGLTEQWRRELLTKFALEFTVVDRAAITKARADDLTIWRQTAWALTSVDFVRQKRLRQALESVEWDLVIIDEAHKLAAYRRAASTVDKRQAYELGEVLARHTTHLLLMTATPHKGDSENYRLLLDLLDPQWGEAAAYAGSTHPLVLRRTKEEMRRADDSPLYPERLVEPLEFSISHAEGELLEQVSKLARRYYTRAQTANQQSAAFALLALDRRLASSPYALGESLKRLCQGLQARLTAASAAPPAAPLDDGEWADWEELNEQERWEREARAEAELATVIPRAQARAELTLLETLIGKAEALAQAGDQAKLVALRDACELWAREQGEQLLIFTEFKDTLDYLVGWLTQWGYTTTQIHGGLDLKARRNAEKAFWQGQAQILVATEAAGEGLNLQCCSVMINYDIPWNPCRLEQRMGRIHRYGQTAPQVHIFNLVARNTAEDEVKAALLKKLVTMRADLGDRVFNVVGEVLWGDDLRQALTRIALGDPTATADAKQLIERAGETARAALTAQATGAFQTPLDVADFRRQQATFAAQRLSPEEAEQFFRQAVPFIGGTLQEFPVATDQGAVYPAFTVTLPPEWRTTPHARPLRLSFWPAVCSDDDTAEDAVLFIAPGHRLFEALLTHVLAVCQADLAQGAVFLDPQPVAETPTLLWFVQSALRDGLDRQVRELLAVVQQPPDQTAVTALPLDCLAAYEPLATTGDAPDSGVIGRVQPLLAAQPAIVAHCLTADFLPALAAQRERQAAALQTDRRFLTAGLTGLAEHWNDAALEAYSTGDESTGDALTERAQAARHQLAEQTDRLERARHLLLTAPTVVGVALLLPAPPVSVTGAEPPPVQHRDPQVEAAAMQAVLAYEQRQGRRPQDVHVGHSWDIESADAQGTVVRYIEVKGRGPADADEVQLTEPEWAAARRLGTQYWLYIVRLADGMLWAIQDPYARLQPQELKRWVVHLAEAARQATDVARMTDL